jgi:hypothetical protein
MNPNLRNFLAVIAGLVFGGMVNMGLVYLSPHIIAPPAGADLTTVEGINAALPLMQAKHFIMPFLAHALGTLCGAYLAAKIAVANHLIMALIIGVMFLIGGFMAVTMIPAPLWFNVLDLFMAYMPMAYLGKFLAKK